MDETGRTGKVFIEQELATALRQGSLENLEKIPEMRNLISRLIERRAEEARLSETLNHLPLSDIQKLFEDYIEDKFDAHLYNFFDRLYKGFIGIARSTISARLDLMEESVADLKRSVLMASLQPYSFVKAEIVKAIHEFIAIQPGQKDTLASICKFLMYEAILPIPGVDLMDKQKFVLDILRHDSSIREFEGFLYELVDHEVREASDGIATSREHRSLLAEITSVRQMDAK